MGVIEIHPWGATVDNIHTPDRMIFDLDPDENVPFAKVKVAAIEIRQRLAQAGLESFLKSTGGKGLHVVVPLAPANRWEEVKDWAKAFAHHMVDDAPDTYVATITKSKRRGKILIDFFRNDYTATGIASYSLRARPGAPVAVPLEWRELPTLRSANQFDMQAVLTRLQRHAPQQAFPKQRLPQPEKEGMPVHGTQANDNADGSAPRRSAA
jgi:bifunctional non-homologous end joining protein LigD